MTPVLHPVKILLMKHNISSIASAELVNCLMWAVGPQVLIEVALG
jgi:hypothetical protein